MSFAGLLVLPLGQPLSSVRVLQLMRMQLTEEQKVLSVFVRRPVLATALWLRSPVTRDGDGSLVTFPDSPEAVTGAKDRAEAIELAADALTTAMDFYFEYRRPVRMPSPLKKEQVAVDLPASVSAKVLLLNEMIVQGKRPAELAKLARLMHRCSPPRGNAPRRLTLSL